MECPHCKNRQGFSLGCCVECGYNHRTQKFEWIRAEVDENTNPLDINLHALKTRDLCVDYSKDFE